MSILRLLEDLDLVIGVNGPITSGSPLHKSIKEEIKKIKESLKYKPIGKMKGRVR